MDEGIGNLRPLDERRREEQKGVLAFSLLKEAL